MNSEFGMGNAEIRTFNEPIAISEYRIADWKQIGTGMEKYLKALCSMRLAERSDKE